MSRASFVKPKFNNSTFTRKTCDLDSLVTATLQETEDKMLEEYSRYVGLFNALVNDLNESQTSVEEHPYEQDPTNGECELYQIARDDFIEEMARNNVNAQVSFTSNGSYYILKLTFQPL
uniref:Uncharacterized protein n=1 Tax=viral metagenome TaxID=1070528 RepID=A0A6C0CIH5_9ZZZZ